MKEYLSISPEIMDALENNDPVVALESNLITYVVPYPNNIEFAKKYNQLIRDNGAIPAITAIFDGKLKVGLSDDELEQIAIPEKTPKASRRDIPQLIANKQPGATTVASTIIIAEMAGIKIFCTGGIGGVHRNATETFDISADLHEMARTDVAVISAGTKSILDIGLTLEYLETLGIPVIGMRTNQFPAFFCRDSKFGVDYRCETEAEVAKILKAKWDMGINGGVVIGNPIPDEASLNYEEMEILIERAIKDANKNGIKGKDVTFYLLGKIKEFTHGRSFTATKDLLNNNAVISSKIALELSKLYKMA